MQDPIHSIRYVDCITAGYSVLMLQGHVEDSLFKCQDTYFKDLYLAQDSLLKSGVFAENWELEEL
jgi:hypothetical protein